jgi:hypothetical protein
MADPMEDIDLMLRIPWKGRYNNALAKLISQEADRYLHPDGEYRRDVCKDWSWRMGLRQLDLDGKRTEHHISVLLRQWQNAYALSMTSPYRESPNAEVTRKKLTTTCEVYFALHDALIARLNSLPPIALRPRLYRTCDVDIASTPSTGNGDLRHDHYDAFKPPAYRRQLSSSMPSAMSPLPPAAKVTDESSIPSDSRHARIDALKPPAYRRPTESRGPGLARRISTVDDPVITNHPADENDSLSAVDLRAVVKDPSDEHEWITSPQKPEISNQLSSQRDVLNPDAVWITQNVVREFLMQHGHGDLFAPDSDSLTAVARKEEDYKAALASALDEENGLPMQPKGRSISSRAVDLHDHNAVTGAKHSPISWATVSAVAEDLPDQIIAHTTETRGAVNARGHHAYSGHHRGGPLKPSAYRRPTRSSVPSPPISVRTEFPPTTRSPVLPDSTPSGFNPIRHPAHRQPAHRQPAHRQPAHRQPANLQLSPVSQSGEIEDPKPPKADNGQLNRESAGLSGNASTYAKTPNPATAKDDKAVLDDRDEHHRFAGDLSMRRYSRRIDLDWEEAQINTAVATHDGSGHHRELPDDPPSFVMATQATCAIHVDCEEAQDGIPMATSDNHGKHHDDPAAFTNTIGASAGGRRLPSDHHESETMTGVPSDKGATPNKHHH